jgi:hypothetical protein
MESWGIPTSTARTPVLAAIWGPIIDPHGQSFRTCFSKQQQQQRQQQQQQQ